MNMRAPTAVFGLLLALAAAPASAFHQTLPPPTPSPAPETERQTITVTTASGAHELTVEVARTQAAQRQGLMFRREIGADGMLFVYAKPQEAGIWMKNTRIPLDILFIDADNRITKIHRAAVPGDTTLIPSDGPVSAILEIKAGNARIWGIKVGDLVHW